MKIRCNFASQKGTRELPESTEKAQQNAKIAQLVEHDLAKVGVAGSSPVFRSKHIEIMIDWRMCPSLFNAKIAQLVEHDLAKVGVAGSSPVFRSNPINRMSRWRNW